MSNIAIGQSPATAPTIDAGDFLPAIDPVAARAAARIDGTVTEARWRNALIEAIATVSSLLDAYADAQISAGYPTLEDVPAPEIDGDSILLHRYRRAVHCLATASVTERYRGFDATDSGQRRADELETPIDDLRRDAHWAISDILGRRRTTIELI